MVHHGDDGAPLIRLPPSLRNGGKRRGFSCPIRWKIKEEARWESRAKIIFQHSCQHSLAKKKNYYFSKSCLSSPPPLPPSRILLFFKTTRVIFKFSILEARSGEEHVRFAPCPESDTVQNRYFEATSDDDRIVCRFVYIITYTRYEAINCSR